MIGIAVFVGGLLGSGFVDEPSVNDSCRLLAASCQRPAFGFVADRSLVQSVGPRVGDRAPVVTLVDLNGRPADLGKYIGKRPVLIQFFAAWCGQCAEQMTSFKAAMSRYDSRVKFIGVAVAVNQSPERARRYARSHGLTHEILYDRRGDAVERYAVPTTSYVVAIDRRGRIVFTGAGGDLDVVAAVRRAL